MIKLLGVFTLGFIGLCKAPQATAQTSPSRIYPDTAFGVVIVGQSTQNFFLDSVQSGTASSVLSYRFRDGSAFKYVNTVSRGLSSVTAITFEPPAAGEWTDSVYFRFANSDTLVGYELTGIGVIAPWRPWVVTVSNEAGSLQGLNKNGSNLLYSEKLPDSSEKLVRRSLINDRVETRIIPGTEMAGNTINGSEYGWAITSNWQKMDTTKTYAHRISPDLQTLWRDSLTEVQGLSFYPQNTPLIDSRGRLWETLSILPEFARGFKVLLMDSAGQSLEKGQISGGGSNRNILISFKVVSTQKLGRNVWVNYIYRYRDIGPRGGGSFDELRRWCYFGENYSRVTTFIAGGVFNGGDEALYLDNTGRVYATGQDSIAWTDIVPNGGGAKLCPIDHRRFIYYDSKNFGSHKRWLVGLRSNGKMLWERRLSFLGDSTSLQLYSDSSKSIVLVAYRTGGPSRILKMNLAGDLTYDYNADSLYLENVISDDSGDVWAVGNRVGETRNSALIHFSPLWKNRVEKPSLATTPIVYPNPAVGHLIIDLSAFGPQTISVVDLLGRPVVQEELFTGQCKISLKGVPSGIYFVKLAPAGKLLKFVLE